MTVPSGRLYVRILPQDPQLRGISIGSDLRRQGMMAIELTGGSFATSEPPLDAEARTQKSPWDHLISGYYKSTTYSTVKICRYSHIKLNPKNPHFLWICHRINMLLFVTKNVLVSCVSNPDFKPTEALHSLSIHKTRQNTYFRNYPFPSLSCFRHLISKNPSHCAYSFKNVSTRTSDPGNLHIIFLALPQSIILTFYIFNPSWVSRSVKSHGYALIF